MQLKHMKRVDVVIEVRDARIPWTTTHPDVPEWARPRPRVIVLTKADLVPPAALEDKERMSSTYDIISLLRRWLQTRLEKERR